MLEDAEVWVTLAFLVFVGVLVYVGVPKLVAKSLDDFALAAPHRRALRALLTL